MIVIYSPPDAIQSEAGEKLTAVTFFGPWTLIILVPLKSKFSISLRTMHFLVQYAKVFLSGETAKQTLRPRSRDGMGAKMPRSGLEDYYIMDMMYLTI